MSSRKKKYRPKSFESTGASGDTSANIYNSMLTSAAFMDLKDRQQVLYFYCKNQYYGVRKPKLDYPDIEAVQSDECFYMNLALAVKYGLYTKSGNKEFYKDMKALVEAGFIDVVSSGKITGKRSIYRFSDRWHNTG